MQASVVTASALLDLMRAKLMGIGFGKKLETNMDILCTKASTIEEQIRKAELSGRKKRKRDVDDWLTEVEKIKEFITLEDEIQEEEFLRHFGGGEVAELDSKVHFLLQQSQHFGELVYDKNGDELVYDKYSDVLSTAELVGKQFQKNLENICNCLMTDDVPCIGIYGMGGIGKTTLAKHINNRILEQTQRCVVWVTVTQEYTISMLQDIIAEAFAVNLSDEDNEDKRALRLHRALSSRKNTLLILDDVWNYIDLEKLGGPLSIDGCGLMITSRSQKLCKRIGCRKLIEVKRLQGDDAWKLFRRTLGQDAELTWQVEDIAKTMARLCDGLPLGVVTLATAMKGEYAIDMWRDELEAMRGSLMGQQNMEEKVFKVLKYSFDRLNQSGVKKNSYSKAQLCFLYCSLYPENCNMEREELVRKFILEGLLDKRDSRKEMFDQGHAILDKLVTCCLLEETHDHVRMHDLVRAMALKITEGKYMVITGNCSLKKVPTREEWNWNLEKVSLSCNSIKEIPPRMSPNCPKLSTLLFNNNPLQFIPDTFFLQIPGLSILDLSRTNMMELPHAISDLVCLKALLLKECQKLKYVPALGKLKALIELDLTHTVIKVPQGMEELENLSFLSLDKIYKLKMLPRGFLLKFPYLQCLYLPYHVHVPGEEVAGLKHLEEFRGGVEDAKNLFMLIKSKNRLAYSIEVGSDFPCYRVDGFRGYNQLLLSRYDFNEAGEENMDVLKQSGFRHLKLYACEGHSSCIVEDLARMSHPSLLESLELYGCEVTEYLFREERFVIPNNWATIIRSTTISPLRHRVFSSLKRLEIFHCNNLKSLGLLVSEILNLESLTIAYCKEIQDIMEVEKHNGTWDPEGENVGVTLPKLKCVFLEDLPKLESFCNAKVVCNSIETISVWGCPALIEFPLVYDQSNIDSSSCSPLDCSLKREGEWKGRRQNSKISTTMSM